MLITSNNWHSKFLINKRVAVFARFDWHSIVTQNILCYSWFWDGSSKWRLLSPIFSKFPTPLVFQTDHTLKGTSSFPRPLYIYISFVRPLSFHWHLCTQRQQIINLLYLFILNTADFSFSFLAFIRISLHVDAFKRRSTFVIILPRSVFSWMCSYLGANDT